MLPQTLLGLKEDAFLLEGSFEGLETGRRTLDYLEMLSRLPEGSVEAAISILDKGGAGLGIAVKNRLDGGDFWFVVPYPGEKSARLRMEKLANAVMGAGIVASARNKKVDAGAFRRSLREYLAVSLAEKSLCDCDKARDPKAFAHNAGRNRRLGRLIRGLAFENGLRLEEMRALEVCCGNGMSTAALKPLFKEVLSIDNDRCAVCSGVYHGTLDPAGTMVVDATALTRYVDEKFDAVAGLMLGTIYEFNKELWRAVLEEAVKSLKDDGFLLFTVNTRGEMDYVSAIFRGMGIHGRVIDNRNEKDIYDGWAFFALRANGKFEH